jgi:hypothetical protein
LNVLLKDYSFVFSLSLLFLKLFCPKFFKYPA